MSEENLTERENEKVPEGIKEETISQDLENTEEKKNFFKGNKPLVIGLGIVVFLLVVYIVGSVIFSGRTMFRTFINGVDCSTKTVEEIKTILSEKVDSYQLEIVTVDEKTEIVKGTDIGLRYENIDELDSLCDSLNAFTWPASIFTQTDLSIDLQTTYDKSLSTKLVNGFDFMKKSKMIAPENAEITGYSGEVKVKKSVFGTTIDEKSLNTKLDEIFLSLGKQLNLKAEKCYVEPELTEESENFIKLKEAAETVGKTRIVYSDSGKTVGIDGNTVVTWLYINDEKNVALNEDNLRGFVSRLSATYNESHVAPRTFKTSYGTEINMGAAPYGKRLNEATEFNRLNTDIMAGKVETLAPALVSFGNPGGGQYNPGGTYVEVNVNKQRLFCYKDGVKVVDTPVITGKVVEGWDTPVGIFSIQTKQTNRVLVGPGYASPVTYWMPFLGDYGLHDCDWRDQFGYDIYVHWGSHGCVNIPPAAAATVFNSVSVGTPVIIYQLGKPDSLEEAVKKAEENKKTEDKKNTEA